ncbi:MAG: ABC transporter permease [Acidobacteriia bacterium]|nr:ABC transporter permease [Terriglobia bacterium]
MDALFQDMRYAIRMMMKSWGFTLVAVISLALGIGANSTIFSWVKSILLRPLPGVSDVGRLVLMAERSRSMEFTSTSYPDFKDFQKNAAAKVDLAAYTMEPIGLNSGERTDRVWSEPVSANYFDVLGVKPVLGRGFQPDEDLKPGGAPVTVLSYGLWAGRFSSDPQIVGKTISLNDHPFTVVGVTPKDFYGSFVGLSMDLWIPIAMQATMNSREGMLNERGSHWMLVFVRPKSGVSMTQAQTTLQTIGAELSKQYPKTNAGRSLSLLPIWKAPFGGTMIFRPVLIILSLVVGVVLLIACANVANLLLARSVGRRKEIAIRLSVGANRLRLVRQLLTESTLLALLGGAAGLLLVRWGTQLLGTFSPPASLPIHLVIETDTRVVLFTFIISVLTGLLFGLVPALQASNPRIVGVLKDETAHFGRARGHARMRNMLVVVQVALSLILLIAAALFVEGLRKAQTIDPGFDPNHVLAASFDLRPNGYNSERGKIFERNLLERVQAIPGVQSASLIRHLPLGFTGGSSNSVAIDGYTPKPNEEVVIEMNWIGPNYFRTMHTKVLQGREFLPADESSTQRYIIINETMARRYWSGRDPVGTTLRIGSTNCQVIGVVQTGKYQSLNEEPIPYMYLPVSQFYQSDATLLVRGAGDPAAYISSIREVLRSMDPGLALFDIVRLTDYMNVPLFASRMAASFLGLLGFLALVLATLGLYSVLAYSVAQRTHEIGIRMALGAKRWDVLGLVARHALSLTAIGIVIGLAGAFGVMRFARNLLYGVNPADPLTFIGLSLGLCLVAILACAVPAQRATRVDPLVALRYE